MDDRRAHSKNRTRSSRSIGKSLGGEFCRRDGGQGWFHCTASTEGLAFQEELGW